MRVSITTLPVYLGSFVVQMTIDLLSGVASYAKHHPLCVRVPGTKPQGRRSVIERQLYPANEILRVLSAPPTWYWYQNVPCWVRKSTTWTQLLFFFFRTRLHARTAAKRKWNRSSRAFRVNASAVNKCRSAMMFRTCVPFRI